MKANEIRVGNWIEKDGKQYPATAMTIFCLGNSHNPIELTEEWLVKLGFDIDKNIPWILHKQPLMCNIGNHFTWSYKGLSIRDIKYVHQLQNLYFALTGEELTITK